MGKYKLTPEAYKALILMADKLPVFQKLDKFGKRMTRIITKFIEQKVNRNHYQKITEPILINHKVNLIEIYQDKGQPAVDLYCQRYLKIKNAQDEKQSIKNK